jgi:hypothetical protein
MQGLTGVAADGEHRAAHVTAGVSDAGWSLFAGRHAWREPVLRMISIKAHRRR